MPGLAEYQKAEMQVIQPSRSVAPVASVGAQGVMSLSQKLESFSSALGQFATQNAKQQAARNAEADMAKYKAQTVKILEDENLTSAQKQEKMSELSKTHSYDGWGATYSKAYSDQFDALYANTITVQVGTQADKISVGSQGDSNKFKEDWAEYSKQLVKSAPNEHLAATTQLTLAEKGSKTYKALATAEYTEHLKLMKKSSEEAISRFKDDYITAFKENDQVAMDSANRQYMLAIDDAVKNRYKTKAQALIDMQIRSEEAFFAKSYIEVERAVGSKGDVTEALQKVYESKGFKALPFEKRNKLMKSMFDLIKEDAATRKAAKQKADDIEEESQEKEYLEIRRSIIKGEISTMDIEKAIWRQEVSKTQGEDLLDYLSKGSTITIQKQLALYNNRKYYLYESTEESIIDDPFLSWEDKGKLLDKRQKDLETTAKWTSSEDGREARRKIKGLFGVQEDTLMASIDLNNETGRALNKMLTDLYDQVSLIEDPLKRSSESLRIANELITEYNNSEEAKAQEQADALKKKADERAQKALETYEDSWKYKWDELTDKPKDLEWFKERESKKRK